MVQFTALCITRIFLYLFTKIIPPKFCGIKMAAYFYIIKQSNSYFMKSQNILTLSICTGIMAITFMPAYIIILLAAFILGIAAYHSYVSFLVETEQIAITTEEITEPIKEAVHSTINRISGKVEWTILTVQDAIKYQSWKLRSKARMQWYLLKLETKAAIVSFLSELKPKQGRKLQRAYDAQGNLLFTFYI